MRVVDKTFKRVAIAFAGGSVLLWLILQISTLNEWLASSLWDQTKIDPGQEVYVAVSIALTVTVYLFGAGPYCQYGRYAAPPSGASAERRPEQKPTPKAAEPDRDDKPKVT